MAPAARCSSGALLRPYLERQPWYRAPGATVRSVRIASHALARGGADPIVLARGGRRRRGGHLPLRPGTDLHQRPTRRRDSGPPSRSRPGPHRRRARRHDPRGHRGRRGPRADANAHRWHPPPGPPRHLRRGVARPRGAGRPRALRADADDTRADGDHVWRRGGTEDPPTTAAGAIARAVAARCAGTQPDVELPMAYANLDLLTPDNRRWPFVLLRSQVPFTDDGWDRSRTWPSDGLPNRGRCRNGPIRSPGCAKVAMRHGSTANRCTNWSGWHGSWATRRRDSHGDRRGRPGKRGAGCGERRHVCIEGPRTCRGGARGADRLACRCAQPMGDADRLTRRTAHSRVAAGARRAGPLAVVRRRASPGRPDDSTPGTRGTTADYGERDIAALAADLAYAALAALQQAGHRDPQDPAGRAWWSIATWALVRGWQEELAAAGCRRSRPRT